LSAHLLVGPLILVRFDALPVLAPLANVIAAPLVVGATTLGGLGALSGLDWLIDLGAGLAGMVLAVARTAVGWPQMGWLGLVASAGGLVMVVRLVRARSVVLLCGAVGLVVVLVVPGTPPPPPAAVFLDVGQGDATLLLTETAVVLIDGGPDELTLFRALQRYHIDHVDLLVVTHAHADHIDGLKAVLGRIPVGAVWQAIAPHETESSSWFLGELARLGIPSWVPVAGATVQLGSVRLDVLGPKRRYAGTNDQSIVLLVTTPVGRLLLAGDAEAIAQQDLGLIVPDVLKVPHHGSDSSDLSWLATNSGELAVVSVGPDNDYGHPSPEVIDTLAGAGAQIHRTDLDGDLVLDLDP
jgi:competence protein ComEC